MDLYVESGWALGEPVRGLKGLLYRLAKLPAVAWTLWQLKTARDTWILLRNCFYDFNRVRKYSSAVWPGNTRSKAAALITMGSHALEKGMSLPNPRPGFGQQVALRLLLRMEYYARKYGWDDVLLTAWKTLEAYMRFQEQKSAAVEKLQARMSALREQIRRCSDRDVSGGIRLIRKEDFLRDACVDLERFFRSRVSVRDFSDEPVDLRQIERAVRMAQRSPSACNRQAGRVHVLHRAEDVAKALRLQAGAEGFREKVKVLLIVTADISCFQSAGERYQVWIDGGLFAMTLVYALHSLGLATCMLNWSKRLETDRLFRQAMQIPEHETIIVCIAVGHPCEVFRVPCSQRRPLEQVMFIHGGTPAQPLSLARGPREFTDLADQSRDA